MKCTKEDFWICYILRCRDRSLYTGITCNLPNRIKQHNNGKGAKYTRSRLPVELIAQSYESVSKPSIMRLENLVKGLTKEEKEELVYPFIEAKTISMTLGDRIWIKSYLGGELKFGILVEY